MTWGTMTTSAQQATSPAQGDASDTTTESQIANASAGDGESQTATDEGAEPGATDPSEGDSPEGEATQETPADKAIRKMERRIANLTAQRGGRDERIRQLETELQEAKTAREVGEDGRPKEVAPDPKALAEEIVLVRETAKSVTKVMKEATTKFGATFEAKVADLVEEIGPQIDQRGRPSPLMEAVLDSDMAAEVLNYLGDNTDIAAELVGLTPARLGRRIERIESDLKAKAKTKPSAAAKPLQPVKAQAVPTVDPAKLTDKQWLAERRKARAA